MSAKWRVGDGKSMAEMASNNFISFRAAGIRNLNLVFLRALIIWSE
jgi:hypothetical protein